MRSYVLECAGTPLALHPGMTTTFDTSAFQAAHGRAPRGRGSWAFTMGAADYHSVDQLDAHGRALVWFAPGSLTFAEAKRLATAEARARRVRLVGVCP